MTNTKTKINTKTRVKRKTPKPSRPAKKLFNLFDYLIFAAVAVVSVIVLATGISDAVAATDADRPGIIINLILNLVALTTSTTYSILSIKGRRSNFIFSAFSVVACAIIAMMNHFYGTAAINIIYYLPCAFIGFYLWGRNSNKRHEVIARKLTARQLILIVAATAVVSLGAKFLLDALGGSSTILDSTSTVISIVANILVLLRFREQWLFWITTDTLQLIMWTSVDNLAMLTLRILYPITAIYGYIYWRKLVKTPRSSKTPRKHGKIRT